MNGASRVVDQRYSQAIHNSVTNPALTLGGAGSASRGVRDLLLARPESMRAWSVPGRQGCSRDAEIFARNARHHIASLFRRELDSTTEGWSCASRTFLFSRSMACWPYLLQLFCWPGTSEPRMLTLSSTSPATSRPTWPRTCRRSRSRFRTTDPILQPVSCCSSSIRWPIFRLN